MRKLIVTNMMTLDGYYEGPGKNVMDLFQYRTAFPTDESFNLYNAERLRAAGTLLLGSTSFEGFLRYWPGVADNPAESPSNREISRLNNAIEKVVVSDHLTAAETGQWRQTTRIIPRARSHEQIARMRGIIPFTRESVTHLRIHHRRDLNLLNGRNHIGWMVVAGSVIYRSPGVTRWGVVSRA